MYKERSNFGSHLIVIDMDWERIPIVNPEMVKEMVTFIVHFIVIDRVHERISIVSAEIGFYMAYFHVHFPGGERTPFNNQDSYREMSYFTKRLAGVAAKKTSSPCFS